MHRPGDCLGASWRGEAVARPLLVLGELIQSLPRDAAWFAVAVVRLVLRDDAHGDALGFKLSVGRGQLNAVEGRSGSGKTPLLTLLGGLKRPTAGRVWIADAEVTALGEDALVARDARVRELLALVGLGARARPRPDELSGSERQRVAITRAGKPATAAARR